MKLERTLGVSNVSSVLIKSTIALSFAVAMGLSALLKIYLPFTPVPVTLQTFVLLFGAGMLGGYYSLQMVGWYLLLGLIGAPFFVGGSGMECIFGATGGYLIGFVFAAAIIGFISKKMQTKLGALSIYLLAAVAIYVPGVIQLKFVTGSTWIAALSMGVFPFIIFDLIKSVLAFAAQKKVC